MNWKGLWEKGAEGSVTPTGALLESGESSGWRSGRGHLRKGLECHAGNLSFLCREFKDTVQAGTQPEESRAGGAYHWAEYSSRGEGEVPVWVEWASLHLTQNASSGLEKKVQLQQ